VRVSPTAARWSSREHLGDARKESAAGAASGARGLTWGAAGAGPAIALFGGAAGALARLTAGASGGAGGAGACSEAGLPCAARDACSDSPDAPVDAAGVDAPAGGAGVSELAGDGVATGRVASRGMALFGVDVSRAT